MAGAFDAKSAWYNWTYSVLPDKKDRIWSLARDAKSPDNCTEFLQQTRAVRVELDDWSPLAQPSQSVSDVALVTSFERFSLQSGPLTIVTQRSAFWWAAKYFARHLVTVAVQAGILTPETLNLFDFLTLGYTTGLLIGTGSNTAVAYELATSNVSLAVWACVTRISGGREIREFVLNVTSNARVYVQAFATGLGSGAGRAQSCSTSELAGSIGRTEGPC
jgi:hypothetical protein